MSIHLPTPIADYVAANARLDVDGMMKPFAADTVILDNGKRFEGHAALRTLFEEEVLAVRAIFAPDAVRHDRDWARPMAIFRAARCASPIAS